MAETKQREFTGKHMIMVVLMFFGTIITVNLIMAYFAVSSWTGLVVESSYVESQHFNEKLAAQHAQKALGWQPKLTYQNDRIVFDLRDVNGGPVVAEFATAELRRPSYEGEDQTLSLFPADGKFIAAHHLAKGAWDVFVSLTDENGTPFIYRERIAVQ